MELFGLDLKAYLVFLVALFVGGFLFNFLAEYVPAMKGNEIISYLISALIMFVVYVKLVKWLRAPPR